MLKSSLENTPNATYRVQLNSDFTFDDARALVPYLAALGISDLYTSPIFQASANSTHGYDVNDYNIISKSLGGKKGLVQLSEELQTHGLKLLIDFVPNHMGIDGQYNLWWRDVLENGSHSKFAPYFDVEWHPRLEWLQERVLVPVLADYYGRVLERGELILRYVDGKFHIHYGNIELPLRPASYGIILNQIVELLPSGDSCRSQICELSEAFENFAKNDPDSRDHVLAQLQSQWAAMLQSDSSLIQHQESILKKINGNVEDGTSFEALHFLLEHQHYRLAYWKVGAHEVNYRRFFAVDSLIGIKVEKPEVFEASHRLLRELLASNIVQGLRLDHIDGLWDPARYLDDLSEMISKKTASKTVYTLVEKILAPGEDLPLSWAVHGTTGYEFTANLIELFLDQRDEQPWTRLYQDYTGETETSSELIYQDKLYALREIFPNAVANLALELDMLVEPDWRWRDLTLHDLEKALRHLLASLPVYRTYRSPEGKMEEVEKEWILQALNEAIRRNPGDDPTPIRFAVRVLTGEYPEQHVDQKTRQAFENWICKVQQMTGAIMAKSVEDTHFYRYVRMVAANEVGHNPTRFGEPVESFHTSNQWRQKNMPLNMLTTSTHDTKWSEDARARLLALAELPDEWRKHLASWEKINERATHEVEGKSAPDAQERYLLYQALVAAWPLHAVNSDETFRARIKAYFQKAQSEAKLNTTWAFPRITWETAGQQFIDSILTSEAFLTDFVPFAQHISRRGMIYSLSQTALKLTCPGVPDIYQGNEIWDFSLVDPDNRRPVDYDARMKLLDQLDLRTIADLRHNWMDGGIKMHVTRTLLQCRKAHPELFSQGSYEAISLSGDNAGRVIAFRRKYGDSELVVIALRRIGSKEVQNLDALLSNITLSLNREQNWTNLMTRQPVKNSDGTLSLDSFFGGLPVATLLA